MENCDLIPFYKVYCYSNAFLSYPIKIMANVIMLYILHCVKWSRISSSGFHQKTMNETKLSNFDSKTIGLVILTLDLGLTSVSQSSCTSCRDDVGRKLCLTSASRTRPTSRQRRNIQIASSVHQNHCILRANCCPRCLTVARAKNT
jgi:hypothetical protein